MSLFGNTKRLEAKIASLQDEISSLRTELVWLRSACTMRVGDLPSDWFLSAIGYRMDQRPVLTAMDAVRELFSVAGIEPKSVLATPGHVEFVLRSAEKS